MAPAELLDRPPSYMKCATLARELDVSESTVHEMVRRGVLPPPLRISSGIVLWCWADVQRALGSIAPGRGAGDEDPFLRRIRHATQA